MRLLIRHGDVLLFWCPGCRNGHPFQLSGPVTWQWNGSMESPTFTPSLVVNRGTPYQCHTIVTSGKIQFCSDCYHKLAGQTVPMIDWDTIIEEEKMDTENVQRPAPNPTTSATARPVGPVLVGDPTATKSSGVTEVAASAGPTVPPPHPDFDRAVFHLMSGGFEEETAKSIVNHVGIEAVLKARGDSRARIDSFAEATAAGTTASAPAGEGETKEASNEGAKAEVDPNQPPEPGMKRCKACGIWYPGGYTSCPHDNTPL